MRACPVTKVIGYLLVTAGMKVAAPCQFDDEHGKFAAALRR
jgi:hypothetical protein